jgi:hypothetical protein
MPLTPLQQIGIVLVLSILTVVSTAQIEVRRLCVSRESGVPERSS